MNQRNAAEVFPLGVIDSYSFAKFLLDAKLCAL